MKHFILVTLLILGLLYAQCNARQEGFCVEHSRLRREAVTPPAQSKIEPYKEAIVSALKYLAGSPARPKHF